MENLISQRLRLFRDSLGLTQGEFGDKCGISQRTYANLENGKTKKVSMEYLNQIETGFPEINPSWLRNGAGPMLRNGHTLIPLNQLPPQVPSEAKPNRVGFPQTPGTASPSEADFVGKYIARLEAELAQAQADKEYLQGLVTDLLGKSPASSDAAGLMVAPRMEVDGFRPAACAPVSQKEAKVIQLYPTPANVPAKVAA